MSTEKLNVGRGIIYILSNRYMPGIIKIGGATSVLFIEQELDNLYIPTPYQCDFAIQVDDYFKKLVAIRGLLENKQIRENYNFFEISANDVIPMLRALGGTETSVGTPNNDEPEKPIEPAPQQDPTIDNPKKNVSITGRFKFSDFDIPAGAELCFLRDTSKKCIVAPDQKHVIYKGQFFSLSKLALMFAEECGHKRVAIQGPAYFLYNGKLLTEIRAEYMAKPDFPAQPTITSAPSTTTEDDDDADDLF